MGGQGRLTTEQLRAALARGARINIEAEPSRVSCRLLVGGGMKPGTVQTARFQAVIVDEVYGANIHDLDRMQLFCAADLPVTLIGDGWQALYDFRGARPDLLPGVLSTHGFVPHQVTHSFRYASELLEEQMEQLRAGAGLSLEKGFASECDVVLATGWDQLWIADEGVLPIGLGLNNKSDALMTMLLNRVTTTRFGVEARNYTEACFVLGVPPGTAERDVVVDAFLLDLRTANLLPTVEMLRAQHQALGLARKPPSLVAAQEEKLNETLGRLKLRLGGQTLVRGLSFHQAKGREYDRVGLKLKQADVTRLAQGLDIAEPDDRIPHVAATRARKRTLLI